MLIFPDMIKLTFLLRTTIANNVTKSLGVGLWKRKLIFLGVCEALGH